MGHHIIKEVSQEKFEFTGRAKGISLALIVIGVILAFLGARNVESNWGKSAEHATEEVDAHKADKGHNDHGDHHATLAQDHGHGGADHSDSHKETADHNEDRHHEAAGHHESTYMSRVWANLLLNSYYFWLFAVAALFFIAVNYVANAGWAVMLKRIMEAQSSYLYIGSAILAIVVIVGRYFNYHHWVPYFHSDAAGNPKHPNFDAILESKHWLLNESSLFFFIPFVLIVWILIRRKLRSNSIQEDSQEGLSMFRNSTRWSAGFIFFFAFSFSALSWLIIMSIDSHWYSTMFSIYNFAVSFVTGLSVMMLLLQYLKSKGYMEMVSDDVVHDLGKFMFAFCIFWGYIFLGQWLLIWYTNLPEETVYFAARLKGSYQPLFFINLFMCFLAPFLVLMMRGAKRSSKVLLVAAAVILIGHWVDVYLLIMPGTVGDNAGIGMLEIGITMAFAGLFIYIVLNSLSKANLYTENHPYLLESANHDVGP